MSEEGKRIIVTFEYSSEDNTFTIRRYENPDEPPIIEVLAAELDYEYERFTKEPLFLDDYVYRNMNRTFWVDDSDVENGGYPKIVFMMDNYLAG